MLNLKSHNAEQRGIEFSTGEQGAERHSFLGHRIAKAIKIIKTRRTLK